MPKKVSKYQALVQLWSDHFQRDRGKGERVDGQDRSTFTQRVVQQTTYVRLQFPMCSRL